MYFLIIFIIGYYSANSLLIVTPKLCAKHINENQIKQMVWHCSVDNGKDCNCTTPYDCTIPEIRDDPENTYITYYTKKLHYQLVKINRKDNVIKDNMQSRGRSYNEEVRLNYHVRFTIPHTKWRCVDRRNPFKTYDGDAWYVYCMVMTHCYDVRQFEYPQ